MKEDTLKWKLLLYHYHQMENDFMKKQRGYFAPKLGTFFIIAIIVVAVLGWATIETLLWLISHINISFGKD